MDKSPSFNKKDTVEAYYRIPTVKDNDFCVTDSPLAINCAGYSQYNCTVYGKSLRKDYYCIYLTNGKIKIDYPISKTMYAGDLVIFSSGIHYDYTGLKPFAYHWIHFTGSYAEKLITSHNIKINEVMHIGISQEALISMQKIMNEFKHRNLFWESNAVSELIHFFTAVGKSVSNSKIKSKSNEMEKAASYIQSNINSKLTVNGLAAMHHMSTSGFRSKFKEYAGISPQEYINTIRLSEASRLLTTTDTSVENIASICGFRDAMYFSRFFKAKTGQSPREYRKYNLTDIN